MNYVIVISYRLHSPSSHNNCPGFSDDTCKMYSWVQKEKLQAWTAESICCLKAQDTQSVKDSKLWYVSSNITQLHVGSTVALACLKATIIIDYGLCTIERFMKQMTMFNKWYKIPTRVIIRLHSSFCRRCGWDSKLSGLVCLGQVHVLMCSWARYLTWSHPGVWMCT